MVLIIQITYRASKREWTERAGFVKRVLSLFLSYFRNSKTKTKEEKGEKLSKWEKVKAASYVPAVLIGAATVTCVIGANLLTSRRQANIASAYALVNELYKQYQNKVREIYGDEVHQEIMELIAAKKAENMAVQAPDLEWQEEY